MTTPTRSPSSRRTARKPKRSPVDFYRQGGDTIGPALIITIVLHILLFEGARHSSLFISENMPPAQSTPITVNMAPVDTLIPADLLPPEMRPPLPKLVDINPLAPSQKPDHNRNTGAADQRAAQPIPDKEKTGDMPRMDGENPDSTRVVNAIPRELLPKNLRPAPGSELGADLDTDSRESPGEDGAQNPSQPQAAPKASDGPSQGDKSRANEGPNPKGAVSEDNTDSRNDAGKPDADKKVENPSDIKKPGEKDGEEAPEPEKKKPDVRPGDVTLAKPTARPQPRPRPRASIAGTSGPLAKNLTSSGEAGVLAVDASFSPMGEYAARMMETIQAAWWISIERSKVSQRGHVVIEFTLNKDGTVTNVNILESSTDQRAAYLCKDSIVGRAPFDPWPADMVGLIGDSHTGRITFHYRGM